MDFQAVTLAVTAPEGDGVPQKLEQFMGGMEDIAQYCKIVSMDEEAALAAITKNPAERLGLGHRLGTLEPGKDADIVVTPDSPFSATCVPTVVVLEGKRVV